MITKSESLNIKSWAPEDRPREKLIMKGKSALSEAELLAILLGSGTKKMSAVEIGKRLYLHADNNLHQLASLTTKQLMSVKGIGEAKAITIVAALELGRRRKETGLEERPKIGGSSDAFQLLRADFRTFHMRHSG